jgi:hypothetical protein
VQIMMLDQGVDQSNAFEELSKVFNLSTDHRQ